MLGAGAMGGLFGFLLAETGQRVTLVDPRPEILAAVARNGLVLEEDAVARVRRDLAVRASAPLAGEADVVLVSVKARDTVDAAGAAAPCLTPETLVLTLQNGLGNGEAITAAVRSAARAAGREDLDAFIPAVGVTACGATMVEPGRVRLAGRGETVLGWPGPCPHPRAAARLEELCRLLRRAGLSARLSGAIQGQVWTKLLVNAGINAATALCGVKNGVMASNPDAAALLRAAVAEGMAVAAALGIALAHPDPAAHALAVAEATAGNDSSMLQDLRAGRPTEIQAINGAIAEQAAALGLPAPVNATLARLVRIRESA
jgi:2-dehydropantoate 2-reductase